MPGLSQATDTVLMLRPAAFGFNSETAASNAFQHDDAASKPSEIARAARHEFDALRQELARASVRVLCYKDTLEPPKPDAVFVNNWISMHRSGDLVLYPMLTPTRRLEVRPELVSSLVSTCGFVRVHDCTDPTILGGVLEGTGSLVLDRVDRAAYACLSPRTERAAVLELCRRLDYEAVIFAAADARGRPIYHTNVILSIGGDFALVCLEAFAAGRDEVASKLEATGHELLPLPLVAMGGFAANMLELSSTAGERLLVGSTRAFDSLPGETRARLEGKLKFVTVPLPTIERYGGGSARCMLAEVHAPDEASS